MSRLASRAACFARTALRGRCEKMAASHGEGSYSTVLGSRYVLLVPRSEVHRGDGMVLGSPEPEPEDAPAEGEAPAPVEGVTPAEAPAETPAVEAPAPTESEEESEVDPETVAAILSAFEDIPGIGPSKAQALFDNGYTSVEEIKALSAEDLAKVEGISEAQAAKVYEALHE